MSIKLDLPKLTDLKPRIAVVGVGGAGCNAINNMIAAGLDGVDFVVANTDAQALSASSAEHRIQLGTNLTEGLGAGSKPEIGEAAAEESIDEIRSQIFGTHMLFIAAGMGGGTGTGAASVIARIARELGILTVAVVTKPFHFEGARRYRIAEAGIAELKKHVDTLIVIPNQNLFRIANEKTTFAEAFILADQVLYSGIACIVDLIVKEGLINLDLADVRTVLGGMGTAMMGTGESSGERRAITAAEEAISNPLLDDVSLRGAKGLLLSIIGGRNLTLYEVDEAASRVRQEVDPEANIIVGATFDDSLGDRVRVSIVASGLSRHAETKAPQQANRVETKTVGGEPHAQAVGTLRKPAHDQVAPLDMSGTAPPGQSAASAQGRPAGAPPPLPARKPHAAGGASAHPQAAPAPQVHEPPARSPVVAPMSAASAPAADRKTWQGPGDVTIEERAPVFHESPAVAAGGESVGRSEGPEFAPQAPLEVRRPQRRVPEIDEFPPIGQKEYKAKSGVAANGAESGNAPKVYKAPNETGSKKGSLLQRLMGGGKSRDSAPERAETGPKRNELPDFFGPQKKSG